MKAAFINAGPLVTGGAQQDALQEVQSLMGADVEAVWLTVCHSSIDGEQLAEISGCDAWIFAFETPGGEMPENLPACLQVLGRFFSFCPHRKTAVYALVLDPDGEHEKDGRDAIEILRTWCEEATLSWGGGVGLSETALLYGQRALAASMRRSVRRALETLAAGIAGTVPTPLADQYAAPDLPRFLRRLMRAGREKAAAQASAETPESAAGSESPGPADGTDEGEGEV